MEYFFTGVVFIFGLLIGSFINVLALRFGFEESPRHRSACQSCAETLHWYELIPVVSYLALRGKCRACGSKISLQYPLVELGVGILFAVSYSMAVPFISVFQFIGFIGLLFFWSAFVVLLLYDIRHTLVPTAFVVPLVAGAFFVRICEALTLQAAFPIYDALFGACALGAAFLAIVLVTRGKGMGLGDVYVSVALGALFGLARGIEVVTLAFWIGAVVGILLIALKKKVRMKSEVPFVPFLFVAALIGAYTTISPFALVGAFTTLLWP